MRVLPVSAPEPAGHDAHFFVKVIRSVSAARMCRPVPAISHV
jgi:hypothetical protein